MMNEKSCLGTSLTLSCGTHPKNDIEASEPSHFDLRPDGGCSLKCDFRLECGHVCRLYCHPTDKNHVAYECKQKCAKPMTCGHKCEQQCSHKDNTCVKCGVKVDKVISSCGHSIKFRCDTTPTQADCREKCVTKLDCGHACTKSCSSKCTPCLTLIPFKLNCVHQTIIQITCDKYNLTEHRILHVLNRDKCNVKCDTLLDCDHKCQSTCGQCSSGYIHTKCNQKCNRILFCGHECSIPCSEQCMPCQIKCENR